MGLDIKSVSVAGELKERESVGFIAPAFTFFLSLTEYQSRACSLFI